MPGKSDEPALPGLFCGFKRLDAAPGREHFVHIRHILYAMHLPQIEVICLHRSKRGMKIFLCALPRALA